MFLNKTCCIITSFIKSKTIMMELYLDFVVIFLMFDWCCFREPQLLKLQLKNVFASVGQRPAASALKYV